MPRGGGTRTGQTRGGKPRTPVTFEDHLSNWEYEQGIDHRDYDPTVHKDMPAPPEYETRKDVYGNNPNYRGVDTTIGDIADFGMEDFTPETFQGKTPDEMADYIFSVKYNNKHPDGATDEASITKFKEEIKQKLTAYAPQLKEPGAEEVGFLEEQYGGGDVSFTESLTGRKAGEQRQQDMYGLQAEAYKATPSIGGTGMGGGMRGGIMGQETIKRGFGAATDEYGLTKDVAGFDYRKGMYGLEKEKEKEWESSFQQFLGSLPAAGGG